MEQTHVWQWNFRIRWFLQYPHPRAYKRTGKDYVLSNEYHQALRITGNPKKPEDYDTWMSPVVDIQQKKAETPVTITP